MAHHQEASTSSTIVPLNIEIETTDSLTPVAGHVCVSYRGCLLCWGGYCFDEREIHYRECNWLYILPYILCGEKNNIWIKVQLETNLQLRPNSGATANVYKDHLYIFGGCLFDEIHRRLINTSTLLSIDLKTGILSPKRISNNGQIPTPRDKTSSWIVDDKFFIFGGYGMSWHRLGHNNNQYFFEPEYFLDDDMGTCWNNQLIYYDLHKECWFEKEQGGKRPSPRAAAASSHVEELNLVFLFGGRHNQSRLNDLYCLDLCSFVWTQLETTVDELSDWYRPIGRSWCSMTLLNKQKKILCYGGLCSRGQSLSDLWELNINEFYNQKNFSHHNISLQQQALERRKHFWLKIPPLEHRLPSRLWHCSVLMGEEAILIYGGMNEAPSSESPFVHTLLVYRLSPPSLRQLALNALASYIVERWIAQTTTTNCDINELFTKQMNLNPATSSHTISTSQQDLQTFADTFFIQHLPESLHSHLRILLCIRRRSKALKCNNGGSNTPRDMSPTYHWQPSPVPQNFHLLNLDGIISDENNFSDIVEDGEQSIRHRRHHRKFPPLSPMSQKRALADELLKLICERNVRGFEVNRKLSFFQTFFNNFDLQ